MERLADSINDTARMARASLTLVMLVALYLSLTLLSSTDEQLLLESDVAVPQINIGISIKTNYIVAPLVFLYLHAQTLFLLSILVRKIRRFIVMSNSPMEHWNWLSAFVFVQLFLPIGERLRVIPQIRRWLSLMLCFISIAVIPILLLFVIDLSFVRYQSVRITTIHYWILVLDITFVILFIIYIIWLYRNRIYRTLRTNNIFGNIIDGFVLLLFVISMLLFLRESILFFNIQPLQFDRSETANDRVDIWKKTEDKYFSKDLFSFVLCDWLDVSCRYYIDVNGKLLTNTGRELHDDTGIKRIRAKKIDLEKRELRYACFRSAELHDVDLRSADLRGADFGSATIHNSNLSQAKLHGANFKDAELKNGTDIAGAKLHNADLSGANLSGADMAGAELHGANLSNRKGTITKKCVPYDDDDDAKKLSGLDEKSNVILHGANLRFAELHGANLSSAKLHGADLSFAKLHGANLRNTELYGANIEHVELDGVDLGGAKLAGKSYIPKSWKFVWISDATSYSFIDSDTGKSIDRDEFIDKLVDKYTDSIKDVVHGKEARMRRMEYEQLLRRKVTEDFFRNKPCNGPSKQDKIHIEGDPHQSTPEWLQKLSVEDDRGYWTARSKWAADFACRNEHTARSTLERWKSDTPLSDIKPESLCIAIHYITKALKMEKNKEEKCRGLHTLPNDEWQDFLRSARSRMDRTRTGSLSRCWRESG